MRLDTCWPPLVCFSATSFTGVWVCVHDDTAGLVIPANFPTNRTAWRNDDISTSISDWQSDALVLVSDCSFTNMNASAVHTKGAGTWLGISNCSFLDGGAGDGSGQPADAMAVGAGR